jgi:sodium/potassium-transporting ATPase subunit alpha
MAPKMSKKSQAAQDAKRELEMIEHQCTEDELYVKHLKLQSGFGPKQGLSPAFVETRRAEEGKNMLTPPPQEPEWKKFAKELFSFFACLLWLGGILCFVGYSLKSDVENLYLGIVLCAVVTITAIFGYFQERKASKLMDSFRGMMPDIVVCIRDGQPLKIDAMELVRGDIIKCKAGDKIPADIRILECSDDCKVDNASLTGESEPQKRAPECTHKNPLETRNLAFFGTLLPSGTCTGIVVNCGDKTVMGRIATLATATTNDQSPIAIEIEHFVHIVSAIAIFLGITFFIIGIVIKTEWITNLVFMIGIIVANVPEGLLATVTVCLTLTAARMAKKSVLVKNLEGVETLGSTTCIASDKTGTLTQNIMTVANVVYNNQIKDAECSLTPVGNYERENASFSALQRCATLCNNAVFDEESKFERIKTKVDGVFKVTKGAPLDFKGMKTMGDGSQMEVVQWECLGDASESAMIKFVQDKRDIMEYRSKNPKLNEIPFNSKNKFQVTVCDMEKGEGPVLLMKGAPERILYSDGDGTFLRCSHVLIDGVEKPMTAELEQQINDCQLELSKKGMRVLAFAQKKLDAKYGKGYKYDNDEMNFPLGNCPANYAGQPVQPSSISYEKLVYIGMTALIDPPRPQVPGAVSLCKTAGIKVIMVTGDHPITAKAIAYKVGILWSPTKEDIEEDNKLNHAKPGDGNYVDPKTAQAVVTPGWTISVDTPVEEWNHILGHPQCVFARTSPQQKLIIVENCQRLGHIVAVTGDGVNDSPALKKADIGVAMGIMGSAVSKEAADMILLDDNFASIVNGVEEGRLIFDNLKKSIAYTLSSNIPEISPFLVFICVQTPLPLTTVLILCVDLGTDMVPAISMAYEKPESDIMQRPPRNSKVDRLVTKKLVSFAYLQIGVIQAASGFFTWMTVLNDYGYAPHLLPGLGFADQWGKQPLYCRLKGGSLCNSGLEGDEVCFKAPSDRCRIVSPFATNLKDNDKCSATNPTGWWTVRKQEKSGIYNCNPDVKVCLEDLKNRRKNGDLNDDPVNDDAQLCEENRRRCKGYNKEFPVQTKGGFPLWKAGTGGAVEDCHFLLQNYKQDTLAYPQGSYQHTMSNEGNNTRQNGFSGGENVHTAASHAAAIAAGYVPYYPHRSRMSPFYQQGWFWKSTNNDDVVGLGGNVKDVILYTFQPLFTRFPVLTGPTGGEVRAMSDTLSAFENQKVANTAEARPCTKDEGCTDNTYLWKAKLHNKTIGRSMYTEVYATNYFNAADDGGLGTKTEIEKTGGNIDTLFKYPFIGTYAAKATNTNTDGTVVAYGAPYKSNDIKEDELAENNLATNMKRRVFTNVFSRMSQKEALHHSQGAFWMCIVVVQWADLLICKTRWLSIREQGMSNDTMNFGLFFETLLAAWLAYYDMFCVAFGTRNIKLTHWFPAMPFSMLIFGYDETRKYLMRTTSPVVINPLTGRSDRKPGWLERNTYY